MVMRTRFLKSNIGKSCLDFKSGISADAIHSAASENIRGRRQIYADHSFNPPDSICCPPVAVCGTLKQDLSLDVVIFILFLFFACNQNS